MNITFYHLTVSPIAKALPRLITKAYESSQRIIIICKDMEQMGELNDVLWTFSTKEFLPHDTIECHTPALQPILLVLREKITDEKINSDLNNADVVVVLDNSKITPDQGFKKCLYMFYGNEDDREVSESFRIYKSYLSAGASPTLWKQNHEGQWVQG